MIDELLADVVVDYELNGRKSIKNLRRRMKLHLLPHFQGRRAAGITSADIRSYAALRQKQGAANAQINRELADLQRAFKLGVDGGKVVTRPKITLLVENNVRQGFFEAEEFESVRENLPTAIQPIVTFAYITGWRINSEVLPLQWRQVDFAAGRVRLEPGTTKNNKAREFPLTPVFRSLLQTQRDHPDAMQKANGAIIPHVFHRDGRAIRSFYDSWRSACLSAGLGQRDPVTKRIKAERIPHDFRRTAVRNRVRAGSSERVAMQMTGHLTRSVFERYHVTSPGDLAAAARRLDDAKVTVAPSMVRRLRGKAAQVAET